MLSAGVIKTSEAPVVIPYIIYPKFNIMAEARALEPLQTPTPEPKEYLRNLARDNVGLFNLASEIIKRESGWVSQCSKSHGCRAGQGLFQVIPSTEKTCEAYFNREMDMLNEYDNIDCGFWLLTNKGVRSGIGHWDNFGIPLNGKQWGSGPYNLTEYGL